ncbi:MAG: serine/threonine protein kinase [Planctomycetes bacterium]|nr:serine/threonine protein kinase [Planctomycetota bacterium]
MNDGGPEQEPGARRGSRPREWPEFPGYRVLGILGRGGMGTIYRAVQLGMERPVAIKVLRSDLAQQGLSVERLQREARVAGRLDHPQIVKGIEVGEHAGRHYFVMEYVDGRSLKSLLKARGVLEEEEVLEIGIQIGRALAHAHTHGIIHRDVKPGNILIGPGGSIKLTDLGLARGPEDPTLTVEGSTVGTPQYMAPEQARDPLAVDRRSDIYALGATLFHALTGCPPFEAETIGQLLTKVLHDPAPDPVLLRPEASEGLCLVIRKTLQKDPSRRYPSAAALLADLQRVRDHLPPRVSASALDELDARLGARIAIAAAGVVLAAVVLLFLLAPRGGDGERDRPVAADPLSREVEAAREAAEAALAGEERAVLLGPYLRVLEMLAQVEAAGAGSRAPLREQLVADRERLEKALKRQLEGLAQDLEQRREPPAAASSGAAWKDAVRASVGAEPARLPPALRSATRELEARVLAAWDARRAQALAQRRAEVCTSFERFVQRDLDLAAEIREGAFTSALRRLDQRYEEARVELKALLDAAAYREALAVLDAAAEPLRRDIERWAAARVARALEVLDGLQSRLRDGKLDLELLADRAPLAWLDELLEEEGLVSPDELPLTLRLERDPFRSRDALVKGIELALKVRREERAERVWAIARANLDLWLPERRYAHALAVLDEKARGELASGLSALGSLEDRRDHLVAPLAALLEAAARHLEEESKAQRSVRAKLLDGQDLKGVPRFAGGGALALERDGLAIGRERPIPLQQVAAESLLTWGGAAGDRGLSALLRFADGLAAPAEGTLDDALREIQALDPTRGLALRDWLLESRAAWSARSQQVREEIERARREIERFEQEGELERALTALRAVSERYAEKPELLTSGFDELEARLLQRRAGARIEARLLTTSAQARVSPALGPEFGGAGTRVVYDLRDRAVAAELRLESIPGWSWTASDGLHRTRATGQPDELEVEANLVFAWGDLDFDPDFPVRVELALRCPSPAGRPFFGSVTQGEWTLGFLGQATLPIRGTERDAEALAYEAGIGWPRGRIFLARGRSAAAVSALLARASNEERPGTLWSAPWNGFLRGTTQRLTWTWTERATRLQVRMGESSAPVLEARPSGVRRRHLREIALRSWDPLQVWSIALEGRLR